MFTGRAAAVGLRPSRHASFSALAQLDGVPVAGPTGEELAFRLILRFKDSRNRGRSKLLPYVPLIQGSS